MEKKINDFFLNEAVSINTNIFISNLIITAVLCFLIRQFYIRYSESLSNKDYFSKNFVILGITTCIVITIVKSSLALSLGLVGALSIVRFRAAIKEPEELVYLFLVIATGLGAGANQIKITFIGILVSLIIIYFFSKIKKDKISSDIFQVSISYNKVFSDKLYFELINILKNNSNDLTLISMSTNNLQQNLNFEVLLKSKNSLANITKSINNKSKSIEIIFSKKDNIHL
jgi:uncharacterized membrane protein YhiD involved in acid resistance